MTNLTKIKRDSIIAIVAKVVSYERNKCKNEKLLVKGEKHVGNEIIYLINRSLTLFEINAYKRLIDPNCQISSVNYLLYINENDINACRLKIKINDLINSQESLIEKIDAKKEQNKLNYFKKIQLHINEEFNNYKSLLVEALTDGYAVNNWSWYYANPENSVLGFAKKSGTKCFTVPRGTEINWEEIRSRHCTLAQAECLRVQRNHNSEKYGNWECCLVGTPDVDLYEQFTSYI